MTSLFIANADSEGMLMAATIIPKLGRISNHIFDKYLANLQIVAKIYLCRLNLALGGHRIVVIRGLPIKWAGGRN